MDGDLSADAGVRDGTEVSAMRKVLLRIIPFAVVGMFISYIDRVNVGFAALEMNRDLGFSATVFGWGVSAFFVTLCLCEVPSNIMMKRFGARIWIARIMITWGIISGAMAFITGVKSFVFVRLLLGAAEAGFFPGIILFLTLWFPKEYRAKAMAFFVMALPVSNFIGSPISGALLETEGWLGLHGWQWLFLIEAAPAVVLGIFTLFWLPSTPKEAAWLTDQERDWLSERLDSEREQPAHVSVMGAWRIMFDPRILALALIYSGSVGCSYAMSYWQPQMIRALGLTNFQTGFVNAIPFGFAAVAMVLGARHSDRRQERLWHTALPFFVCALGLAACVGLTTLVPTVCALTVAVVGSYAVKAPLFALTAESLSEQASPVGIAQVCAIGNIAGLVCPLLIGWAKDASGSFSIGLLPMVALALIAAATTIVIGRSTVVSSSRPRLT
ncbi:MFS transporter [Methylobacterium sp. J-077]|uniref:MFS transporter n=1 Tax=Methylobacterium sp. J-077 TaxID=2836656 RepID=UPI001FB9B689|nr:MFS transporter [Methylobacterium sp. J-077]MCJ2121882.1 MFS transporter [Methylobacterium sp. J-077]